MRDMTDGLSGWICALAIVLGCNVFGQAQQTAAAFDPYESQYRGDELFTSGLFYQAFQVYDEALQTRYPENSPGLKKLYTDLELNRARSAIRCGYPEGEEMMRHFILTHRPEPVAIEATIDLADFYYNKEDYKKSIEYFRTLRSAELNQEQLSEVRFKQGYSHFALKEFTDAEFAFGEVREIKSVYYYPVNYYSGMCQYYRGDLDSALESYERVSHSDKYKDHVPYYITQILLAQGKYGEVITYAVPKLGYEKLKNREEIGLILGRAYFETGDYASARPYLEQYAALDKPMRAEDFYQLAFVQYTAGDCPKATESFQSIASQDDSLGQRANFYLADCYLKSGEVQSAHTAFRNASKMPYDKSLQQEALLQYGKVSAQLNFDGEAIRAMDQFTSASPWYQEAQEVLKDVFGTTRNYAKALGILDDMPQLSPALREAYQQLSLNYGKQLVLDGNLEAAQTVLKQVEQYPVHQAVSAEAFFWRAEIAHRQSQYEASGDLLRQYFTLSKAVSSLPTEASPAFANYMQGYNYLHQQNFIAAQGHFVEASALFKKDQQRYGRFQYTLLSGALLRAGDCAFKRNQYADARQFYSDAQQIGGPNTAYAKYQQAIISGLEGNPNGKIRILEGLVIDHPESDLADDVLLQLGMTYHDSGQTDKAEQALNQLLARYPDSDLTVDAVLRLGLIRYNSGRSSEALTYYKRIFTLHPTADQAKEALSAIEEIYVQDLKTPDAYLTFVATIPGYEVTEMKRDSLNYRVAEIQYEQAEYQGAVRAFTKYLDQFPSGINIIPAHFYRGDAHALLTEYPEALADFEAVIAMGKSNLLTDALAKAAVLAYNHAQDFERAYRHYQQLYELTSDAQKQYDAALGMLRSAYRSNRPEEVMRIADNLHENPLASESVRGEIDFYQGKALMEQQSYSEALAAFRRTLLVLDNVQAAEARFRIAQVQYLIGAFTEAEQAAHAATRQNTNYPYWVAKSLILLSDIAVGRNDLFNAKAPLEAVIENFQGDAVIIREAREKLDLILQLENQQSRIYQDTSGTMDFIKDEEH